MPTRSAAAPASSRACCASANMEDIWGRKHLFASIPRHWRHAAWRRPNANSNPHWHQHVEGAAIVAVAHDGRRASIRQLKLHALALDLIGDVQQVTRIKTNFERSGRIARFELLFGLAVRSEERRVGKERRQRWPRTH